MVKALEDVSVKYDNTVRNSRGLIIQFLYGEDGIDATYMENLHLKLLNYNGDELEKLYNNPKLPKEFEMIKQLQHELVEITCKRELNNAKLNDDYFPMPVNINRILNFVRSVRSILFDNNSKLTDQEMFDEVMNLSNRIANIFLPTKDQIEWSEKLRSSNATKLFRIYVHSELATMRIKDLTRHQLLYVIEDIELKFKKAIVSAGEMCGILAAQSIGELTTQLTLNTFHSVDYNETLIIDWTGEDIPPCRPNEKIGKFIDSLIEKYPGKCQIRQDGSEIYLPLEKGTAKALSVDENGTMIWTELEAVTKHLPINKDGTNTLFKVKTQSGREIRCTKGKSFLIYSEGKIVKKEGFEIEVGDLIPIVNKLTNKDIKTYLDIKTILQPVDDRIPNRIELDREFGFFIGTYLAKGSFATEWTNKIDCIGIPISLCQLLNIICGIELDRKVPEFAYNAPDSFVKGLLDGYIYEKGVIENGIITIHNSSKELRDGISLLLSRFSIQTKLVETEYKIVTYATREFEIFEDTLLDPIVSIEECPSSNGYVYDLTVEKTYNMCSLQGINLNDSAGISAKNVTLGVPRLKELINVTKKLKAPSLTMYEKDLVKDLNPVGQKRIVEGIRSSLEYKTIQDIIRSSDIVYSDDEEYSDDNDIIDVYKELYEFTDSPFPENFISLRLQFSSKELEYVDTSLFEISKLLEKSIGNGHKIICSDDNTEINGKENLFIRIICSDANEENQKEQIATLRKIEIFCMSIKIKGCEGISRVYTREAKINKWTPEKGHYKDSQWILETEGTNLIDTMENDSIDHTRTISNNVIEIYEIFGIEAARQALLNELRTVLSFDGSYVNYRHLAILVDTMTCRGSLTAMTRHGINRVDSGTLAKSSFEETVEVLTDAAAFGEIDTLKGISDNIMLGQTIPAGTGVVEIIYDTEMEPDKVIPAISREPTPMVEMNLYIPSEPEYDPLSAWNY